MNEQPNLKRPMTVMLLINEITMRLIDGETEINIKMIDERSATHLLDSLRRRLDSLGLTERFKSLNVILEPEGVIVKVDEDPLLEEMIKDGEAAFAEMIETIKKGD